MIAANVIIAMLLIAAAVYFVVQQRKKKQNPSSPPRVDMPPIAAPAPVAITVSAPATPAPVAAPVPVPVSASPRTTMRDSYPTAQDCQNDADRISFGYAIMVDGTLIHHGFGPALQFYAYPDGSVKMTKPQMPPVPAPVDSVRTADAADPIDVTLGQGNPRVLVPGFLAGQTLQFRVTAPAETAGKLVRISGAEWGGGGYPRNCILSATRDGAPMPGIYSTNLGNSSVWVLGAVGDGDTIQTASGPVAAIKPGSTVFVRVSDQATPAGTPTPFFMDFYLQNA